MDDYNWDDFDSQAGEYLNSGDYQGGSFTTPDDMSWGGQGANNADWSGSDWQMPEQNFDPTFGLTQGDWQTNAPQNWQTPEMGNMFVDSPLGNVNWGSVGNKGLDFLGKIFSGSQGQGGGGWNSGSTQQLLKGLGSMWAAQQEKKNQQQLAGLNRDTIQQQQQRYDPFAGQRERYMQELSGQMDRINQFRANPDANSQYATLKQDLMNQAMRGARQRGISDVQMTAALAPQLTKTQMAIEDQMQSGFKNLFQPSGANLSPYTGGLAGLLGANQAGVLGDSNSGYAMAISKMLSGNPNSGSVEQLRDQLIQSGVLKA
jgi:hypothetical protein